MKIIFERRTSRERVEAQVGNLLSGARREEPRHRRRGGVEKAFKGQHSPLAEAGQFCFTWAERVRLRERLAHI